MEYVPNSMHLRAVVSIAAVGGLAILPGIDLEFHGLSSACVSLLVHFVAYALIAFCLTLADREVTGSIQLQTLLVLAIPFYLEDGRQLIAALAGWLVAVMLVLAVRVGSAPIRPE